MANKKGFIMYADLLENIELLSMEQRGILLTAILCDQSAKEPPEMDGAVRIAFSFIKKGIDLNTNKYNEICEKRRESGKKGGRPSKANETKQKQMKANESNTKAKKPDNREQITDNSKQITDNRDKQREESVSRYGEYNNVILSEEEVRKLKLEFPYMWKDKLEALSEYMVTHNKQYASHYATIRRWIRTDLKKEGEEGREDNSSGDKGKVFKIEDVL